MRRMASICNKDLIPLSHVAMKHLKNKCKIIIIMIVRLLENLPSHQWMCHIHSTMNFNSVSEFVCNCKSISFNRLTSDIDNNRTFLFFTFSLLFTIIPYSEYYYIKLLKLETIWQMSFIDPNSFRFRRLWHRTKKRFFCLF